MIAANYRGTQYEQILDVLRYFSVFKYPLSELEIQSHCSTVVSIEEVEEILQQLVSDSKVFRHENLFCISRDAKDWVARRRAGNKLAGEKMVSAVSTAKFIYLFPFVAFVGISGSLSKGFATADGDFDFFIITSPNRLWICRTILHLFKKLSFIVGAQHRFCMNYFIDISHAAIEERNRYTAIELSSLIPVCGLETYRHFLSRNKWVKEFLPNCYRPFYITDIVREKYRVLRIFEMPFLLFGNRLNRNLMKFTDRKWRRKWAKKNYPMQDYDLAFKTTLYHSKNHPKNYQKRILEQLASLQTNVS